MWRIWSYTFNSESLVLLIFRISDIELLFDRYSREFGRIKILMIDILESVNPCNFTAMNKLSNIKRKNKTIALKELLIYVFLSEMLTIWTKLD